jgi:hypothetical protein
MAFDFSVAWPPGVKVYPWSQSLPLGVKVYPWGQSLPLGSKFTPWEQTHVDKTDLGLPRLGSKWRQDADEDGELEHVT